MKRRTRRFAAKAHAKEQRMITKTHGKSKYARKHALQMRGVFSPNSPLNEARAHQIGYRVNIERDM